MIFSVINWEQWAVTALPFILGTLGIIFRNGSKILKELRCLKEDHVELMADLRKRNDRDKEVVKNIETRVNNHG